jgi:hypothetical protein
METRNYHTVVSFPGPKLMKIGWESIPLGKTPETPARWFPVRVTILKVLPASTRAGRLSPIETLTGVESFGMRGTVQVVRFIAIEL